MLSNTAIHSILGALSWEGFEFLFSGEDSVCDLPIVMCTADCEVVCAPA